MTDSLTILSVAYPFAPVGPDSVGGAEQVLTALDRTIVEAGHRSIVVACEGSITAGRLLETPAARGELTESVRRQVRHVHSDHIRQVLQQTVVDVVHLHGIDCYEYLPPPGVPALITLHLPPAWYPRDLFFLDRPETWLHCVSRTQQGQCPPGAKLVPVIDNGVDCDALRMRCGKRDYVLALGRICPEKNFHMALDAARQAGVRMLLAGEVFAYGEHQRYHREQILPRLDAMRRFIGPVGLRRKRRLMTGARCLLVPSLAPETSSLVAMEALACGTPVIAMASGALPEIVEHGTTGLIVRSGEEMVQAIRAVNGLDPSACRDAACRRFSIRRTVARYMDLYRRLAKCTAIAGTP